jgi:hypothetical protein
MEIGNHPDATLAVVEGVLEHFRCSPPQVRVMHATYVERMQRAIRPDSGERRVVATHIGRGGRIKCRAKATAA